MLFSLSAATVKFAHSHAFFVSLTFHVEAKASAGGYFPTSFAHPMRSHYPESRECQEWRGLRASEQHYMLSDGMGLVKRGGRNVIHFYNTK